MSGPQDNRVAIGFTEEIKGHIPSLKKGIERLYNPLCPPDTIRDIHRQVHMIKGAASLIGFQGLTRAASEMETALDGVMAETWPLNRAFIDAMALGIDALEALSANPAENEEATLSRIMAAFDQARSGTAGKAQTQMPPDPFQADSFGLEDPELQRLLSQTPGLPEQDAFLSDDDPFMALAALSEPDPLEPDPLEQDIDDSASDITAVFREEAEAHLETVNRQLEALEQQVTGKMPVTEQEKQCIQKISRAVHTLKGASGLVGMTALSAWAHKIEDLLDWLFDKACDIDPRLVQTLLKSADILERLVTGPDRVQTGHMDALEQEFVRITGSAPGVPPGSPPPAADPDETKQPANALPVVSSGTFRIPMDKLDELVNLASEQIISLSAFDQRLGTFQQTLDDLEILKSRLRGLSRDLEVGYEVKAIQKTGEDAFNDFDALELDRYSEFNLIIRALAESVVDIGEITSRLQNYHSSFDGYVTRQRALLTELQTKLMGTRMAPMSVITTRMRRAVREVAAALDKSVRLTIHGEDIELDRTIWERLADPLLHILRNAVDHGIESPMARADAGKDETGSIRVSASRQGNQVLIHIRDDGAGLDFNRIKARAEHLFGTKKAAAMDREELAALVFMPGFTTRDTVTQISGRGLGMDVVQSNIQELKGTVRISSAGPGQGTDMTVQIPLTLAVIQAVICRSAERSFALPLNEVKDILRVAPEQIISKPSPAIATEQEVLPLYQLSRVLGISHTQAMPDHPIVLKVGAVDQNVYLAVDALEGQQEIVIKSLGSHLQYVRGISGVTVMGDGSVIPILNVPELLQENRQQAATPLPLPKNDTLEILVVDDSVSVRHVVSRLMESQGWQTLSARDGLEALETLADNTPDLIVLDIEMPRMNGYEFLGARRASPEYQKIPVIILTSRSTAKYRKKAADLGADEFIVKPFNDTDFINTVRRLTSDRFRQHGVESLGEENP